MGFYSLPESHVSETDYNYVWSAFHNLWANQEVALSHGPIKQVSTSTGIHKMASDKDLNT